MCRALRGVLLPREVYALDGTARAGHPYTVTEQNFTMRLVQPRAGNRHAVFLTSPGETLEYRFERDPANPRIGHTLCLEADHFGNTLKEATSRGRWRAAAWSDRAESRAGRGRRGVLHEHGVADAVERPGRDEVGRRRVARRGHEAGHRVAGRLIQPLAGGTPALSIVVRRPEIYIHDEALDEVEATKQDVPVPTEQMGAP